MTKRLRLGLLRDLALSLTAAVGALCLVLLLAGLAFGVHPLLFRSGSMSPAIHTGDLAFARTVDASGLHRGDVVSVIATGGQRVTHRVVSNSPQGGGIAQLQLKGDANKTPDTQVYDVKTAEKVFWNIPNAGYVVSWLSRAPGSYLLAAYVALMLLLMLRRRPEAGPGEPVAETVSEPVAEPVAEPAAGPADEVASPSAPGDHTAGPGGRARKRPLKAAAIAGGFTLGLVALAGWGQSTGAFGTDTAAVSGTSFTAGTTGWGLPAPTFPPSPCSADGGKAVKVTWNTVTGAVKYRLTITHVETNTTQTFDTTALSYTISYGNAQQTGTFTVQAVDSTGAVGSSATLNYVTANGSGTAWSCT